MAWADAGQRLEAMSTVRTGCNFAVPNRPAVSTPAATTCRRWYQSLAAGGLNYDHVSINSYNVFDSALPFGGYKQSGWGREMGHHALELYTEVKSVVVGL